MRSRTRNLALLPVFGVGTLVMGLASTTPAAGQDAELLALIDIAMSAAPATVSAGATILTREFDDAG